MSNEVKNTQNQIILLLVSPPFFFLLLNFVHPFLWLQDISSSFRPDLDFENQHYLGLWILLFFIPYAILFYNRNNENIYFPTKLAICGSAAISFLDPATQVYGWPFLIMFALMTGGAMYGLYWKAPEQTKQDNGDYPLVLDHKGKKGFPTSSLHENVQIVGGTGTGKTHYVIKPFIQQTIRQDLGCFILDVKSNMFQDVAYYASQAKRTIQHFTLANYQNSHTYNPLYGDNPDAIANRLFTALYYDTRNSERYYVDLADAFLHNLIGLFKRGIKTLTFTDLLTATQEVDTFRTITWFCAKYPDTHYSQYFRDQWLSKSPKDRRAELSGLINKLQRFCNSEWSHLLNVRKPDIRMDYVVSQGDIFLFSPDSARYPEDAKPLCILAMMDLAEKLADRYQNIPKKPFRVFLDEFYNLAYPKFIDFINKCREARVNLFLAHQSLGDLKGVSMEFLEQVMNTASNKIILRVNDPDTAEAFARQFGTERDTDYKVESFGADGLMSGYSKPQVEKFRFHPNLIKELRVGEAIVKIVGEAGINIFKTRLQPAEKAPEDFNPRYSLTYSHSREKKNESSLPELMQDQESSNKNPKKDRVNGMGDEDAA